MKLRSLLPAAMLLLMLLGCPISWQLQSTTVYEIAEGFEPTTENTHEVYLDNELYATIEYKNDTLSIYSEPGHILQDSLSESSKGHIEGSITAEYADIEASKKVEFFVLEGMLFIRETESGRSTLDT